MAKLRASQDKLGQLHQKLAEVMIEALEGESFTDPDTGEVTTFKANNPALFTAVAKFLKDNDIVAIPESADAVDELMQKLTRKKPALPEASKDDVQWPTEKAQS